MQTKKTSLFISKGFIVLSALSFLSVSLMAFVNPQSVMDLVAVKLSNTDAVSSIRGVYGGVGLTLFIVLLYTMLKNVREGLGLLMLLWGFYAASRLITIANEGSLGAFGQKWLTIETVFFVVSVILFLIESRKSERQTTQVTGVPRSTKAVHQLRVLVPAILIFCSCNKGGVQQPSGGTNNQNPDQTGAKLEVKLQAVIRVGTIMYDSIPAQFIITSWDANNIKYEKDTLLGAGIQTVQVPASHVRFAFRMIKWGIVDETVLTKGQLEPNVVYTLGGSKSAKRIAKEESYIFTGDAYQLHSKVHYSYHTKGIAAVEFYQKKPQYADLKFTTKHLYSYTGSEVTRIDVFDEQNNTIGFTDFTYNPQFTRITHMHQSSQGTDTYAAVDYSYGPGSATVSIDYLYNNGHAMTYSMKIKGGNKIEEQSISSTGAGEAGTYSYDMNINPFAHLKMPDLFFSNFSKNNVLQPEKSYSGNVPTAVVYKQEYVYDSEGYPTEVVKYYKGYQSGADLYKIKTVYSYL